MEIGLGGMARGVAAGSTVADVLARDETPPDRVIVEVNGRFVPPAQHGGTVLASGDRVEIIWPVWRGSGAAGQWDEVPHEPADSID